MTVDLVIMIIAEALVGDRVGCDAWCSNSPARSDGKVEVDISGKMLQINPQLLEFR